METNISNVIDSTRPLFENIGQWTWYADNWIAVVSIILVVSGFIVYKTTTKRDDIVFAKIAKLWEFVKYFFKK